MKRLTLTAIMIFAAAFLAAENGYQHPEPGVYQSTSEVYAMENDRMYEADWTPLFRVAFDPEDKYSVGILWDYDGDGLKDESIEVYDLSLESGGVSWVGPDLAYHAYYDADTGKHQIVLYDGDVFYIIELNQITSYSSQTNYIERGKEI